MNFELKDITLHPSLDGKDVTWRITSNSGETLNVRMPLFDFVLASQKIQQLCWKMTSDLPVQNPD